MSSPSTSFAPEPPRTVVRSSRDVPIAVVVCLASVASFFAMGWSLGGYLYDRLRRDGPG